MSCRLPPAHVEQLLKARDHREETAHLFRDELRQRRSVGLRRVPTTETISSDWNLVELLRDRELLDEAGMLYRQVLESRRADLGNSGPEASSRVDDNVRSGRPRFHRKRQS